MELKPDNTKNRAERDNVNVADRLTALFDSDALLPAQYFGNYRRQTPLEPEIRLMLAILEDAVHCLRDNVSARGGKRGRLFQETEAWMLAQDDHRLFSFENICAALGIDPAYLRRGLLRWQEKVLANLANLRAGERARMAG